MRVTSTYYRAIGPDKRLICESKNAEHVLDTVRYVDVPVTFQRMVIFENSDGWQPWNPEEEEEENATAG